jgi:hypothetical protein
MNKTLLLAAAAAICLAGGATYAATPEAAHFSAAAKVAPNFGFHPKKLSVLYNQTSNNSGIGIDSQMFESEYSVYDDQAADDFTVPKGSTWTVEQVDASGEYFNGSGPAASENVYFYKASKKGGPKKLLMSFTGLKGKDSSGSFTITLPKGGMVLKAGHYFVSVQANCSFSGGCGEWGWNTTSAGSTTYGSPAYWENPGDGFGVCPSWGVETTCVPAGQGDDQIFELLGTSK